MDKKTLICLGESWEEIVGYNSRQSSKKVNRLSQLIGASKMSRPYAISMPEDFRQVIISI